MLLRFMCVFAVVLSCSAGRADEELDYVVPDPALKVVRLDTSEKESFLAVKADSEGRIFVGSRAALFVYDGKPGLTLPPRTELVRFPDHTWVYDIEFRGDDVYVLTVSALYVIPEGRVKRTGLQPKRLVWGVPLGHVHQCFHGMTWGPEGDLYFATGDPLWYYGDFNRPDHWGHWTMFSRPADPKKAARGEWERTPYNGVGAVFRCKADGSGLKVVARGLRNSCGLVFDKHWNLFTNDNDHESMPAEYVPGRLNHVTPHSYFSWPRGWMKSKTPDRADLLDTMITTMGRAVPVGQWYYDDPILPEQYRNSLLVARWCTRKITYYPLQPHGSTFKCEEKELLVGRNQARPVGVTTGWGGRVFATICYMAQNEGSPVYRSDLVMITRKEDDPATFVIPGEPKADPFVPADLSKARVETVVDQLKSRSWSQRYAAHRELSARKSELQALLPDLVKEYQKQPEMLEHLVWLADESGKLVLVWKDAYQSKDDMVRLQTFRAMVEVLGLGRDDDREKFIAEALADKNPQIQLAAVTALFQGASGSVPQNALHTAGVSDDTYLRQAATLLLAEHGKLEQINSLCSDADPKRRLAGVLSAGFRLTMPKVDAVLPVDAALSPWRNEAEATVIQFADAKVDLKSLGRVGTYTVADHWKGLQHSVEQETLFALLMARLDDPHEPVRLQAAWFLSLLNDPRAEPKIGQVRSDISIRRLSVASPIPVTKAWIVGPFADNKKGFATAHAPESGLLDPARTFAVEGKTLAWKETAITRQVNFLELFGPCDDASCYTLYRLESSMKQPALLTFGSDDGIKVWHNGREVFTNDVIRGALPLQDVVPVELQAGGNDILVRVRNVSGECGLYLHYRALQPVVAVLPEKLGTNDLAARLKAAATDTGAGKIDPAFVDVDWSQAVKAGNVEQGRKLFGANGLGCSKCHAVTPDAGGNAGPSLADALKRFTAPYVVESVLLPSKQVSPVFKATLILTTQGKTFVGLVIGETGDKLEMILTDTTKTTIMKTDIEERKLQDLSPMPAGLVKTPAELRDLLAYLLSENPKAP